MDQSTAWRLRQKAAQEAIVARIAEDLHLAPFLARAYYEQMATYFQQYAGVALQAHQLSYCAIAATEPAGRKLAESERLPVRLTWHAAEDLAAAAQGLAALRQQRLVRLCREAQDQGALLTQEDLALLLTTSVSTIKRDLRTLRAADVFVPTRGQQRDIGPGVSHKCQIVRRYLHGESLTDLRRRLPHGPASSERYLQAFRQVALMTREGLAPELIRRATRLSARLVAHYQALYEQARDDPAQHLRLQDLLGAASAPAARGGRSA